MTRPVIISGGQTGIDRGALDAALTRDWPCRGWCPRGRRAEDGRIPARYPLRETTESDYSVRTRRNVADSDVTLILAFGSPTGGTLATLAFCRELDKPMLLVDASRTSAEDAASQAVEFIRGNKADSLNVAGPRESGSPGARDYARDVIERVLDFLDQDDSRNALVKPDSEVSGGPQTEPRQ